MSPVIFLLLLKLLNNGPKNIFLILLKSLDLILDLAIYFLDLFTPKCSFSIVISCDGGRRYADNTVYFFEWVASETTHPILDLL